MRKLRATANNTLSARAFDDESHITDGEPIMISVVASPTFETLLYEKKGAIAYVTLNRPKVLNALNRATWEELRTAFEHARDDEAVRGVILTGAGDKAFIAGADIGELAHISAVDAEESSAYG